MDFESWDVDLAAGEARHGSGCVVRVEGNPSDPSAVEPSGFPEALNYIDQARLLRCGIEALAQAADRGGARGTRPPAKSQTVKALEKKAQLFADNPDKPKRAVLSLKKRSREPVSEK
jgi:hypothetical protein